jgi:serine phosphatase RsbU (regulator of sigma subunit)
MNALFDAQSYQFDALSIPFIVAGVIVAATCLYLIITDGAALLRGSLLLVAVGLLLFVSGYVLVGSTDDPEVATIIYRWCVALLPLTSAGAMTFLLALSGRLPRYRGLIAVAIASSLIYAPLTAATDLVIDGVWRTPSGLFYFTVPTNGISQLQVTLIGLWVALGVYLVWRRVAEEPSDARRRQLRGSVLAFSICALGLSDVPLAYGVGWYPLSWVFLTIGVSLALRLLIADDLVHARALDRRLPLVLIYVAGAVGGVIWIVHGLGPDAPVLAVVVLVAIVFAVLRTMVALARSLASPTSELADSPLERALERYGRDVQSLRDQEQIGRATLSVIELGVGCEQASFLMPSRTDYSWETLDGEVVPEARTPDPLTLVWLEQHGRPIARDDLPTMRLGDMREPVERLFDAHAAEMLVPLVSRDEVVGMIALGQLSGGRAYRQEEHRFLGRLQEQAAAALVYARMHRDATERVEVDKEVGLAAAVQSAFVPGPDVIDRGGVRLAGIYEPASRCGGDWWSVHELPSGRVLVLIGDVTGHGVAAAMVTAAAKGCYDVAQRLMGDEIELPRLLGLLDASVRRAGAAHFYMTCFATLIDADAGTVRYANAGHVVPYLCRPKEGGGAELDVLVARGDPLGAGGEHAYVEHERDLSPGDVLIWYTDGLVECTNPRRQQFGDRRMQRMLRRLKLDVADVPAVRDTVVRAAVAFQEGRPADDDITLVVGRIGSLPS